MSCDESQSWDALESCLIPIASMIEAYGWGQALADGEAERIELGPTAKWIMASMLGEQAADETGFDESGHATFDVPTYYQFVKHLSTSRFQYALAWLKVNISVDVANEVRDLVGRVVEAWNQEEPEVDFLQCARQLRYLASVIGEQSEPSTGDEGRQTSGVSIAKELQGNAYWMESCNARQDKDRPAMARNLLWKALWDHLEWKSAKIRDWWNSSLTDEQREELSPLSPDTIDGKTAGRKLVEKALYSDKIGKKS